jgi:hypothetical protein
MWHGHPGMAEDWEKDSPDNHDPGQKRDFNFGEQWGVESWEWTVTADGIQPAPFRLGSTISRQEGISWRLVSLVDLILAGAMDGQFRKLDQNEMS